MDRINDGSIYRVWWATMDPDDVGRMAPPWRSDWGYNCTSLYNDILGEMVAEGWTKVAPVGGTGVWNSTIDIWESTVLAKNYPPGFFAVSPYISDNYGEWGHLQMVWSGEAADGNQIIAQSDASNGLSADGTRGWPGPNINYSMYWSFNNIDFPSWMGLIPGVRPIDGFPGYDADAYEIVRWHAKVCEWWYDMPLIIPLTAMATELTPVIDPNRTMSIWDIPGYADPLDHDSYGPYQGRAQFHACQWNFQTALWTFLARVDKYLEGDAYPDPDDPRAVAEVIQGAQRSFADGSDGEPVGWNYEARYEWAHDVMEEAVVEGADEPELPGGDIQLQPTPPEYIAITKDRRWLQADGPDWGGGWYEPRDDGSWEYKGGK
jgi:hypothetical protein